MIWPERSKRRKKASTKWPAPASFCLRSARRGPDACSSRHATRLSGALLCEHLANEGRPVTCRAACGYPFHPSPMQIASYQPSAFELQANPWARGSSLIAPAVRSTGMADGGSGDADTSNTGPTWAASEANLRDHAVRLRKRRRRYCLRRSCYGYDKASSSNQPDHSYPPFFTVGFFNLAVGGSKQRGMPRSSFLQLRRKGQRIVLLVS